MSNYPRDQPPLWIRHLRRGGLNPSRSFISLLSVFIGMPLELPDYSYGCADSVLQILDYMIRTGTDTGDGEAASCLRDARYLMERYKALICPLVME